MSFTPPVITLQTILDGVLFQNDDLLVINKPNRLPLYPGPGGGVTLAGFLEELRFGHPEPPAPAHRLDSATTGCLILGRSKAARAQLTRLFETGQIDKTYWAVVQGTPLDDEGTIDLPLKDNGWPGRPRMIVGEEGKKSVTAYRILRKGKELSWLELTPKTGRTHQLRVHCAALDCPIVGDPLYGNAESGPEGTPLHLHARSVTLPWDDASLTITAPPHPYLQEALEGLATSL